MIARILKASWGKSGKQQQGQTLQNHVEALISGPVFLGGLSVPEPTYCVNSVGRPPSLTNFSVSSCSSLSTPIMMENCRLLCLPDYYSNGPMRASEFSYMRALRCCSGPFQFSSHICMLKCFIQGKGEGRKRREDLFYDSP